MCAWVIGQDPRFHVVVYEKNPSLGRKILVAGSSGLNVSHDLPLSAMAATYEGTFSALTWNELLENFSQKDWHHWIENLGFETYVGTSKRTFIREKKASTFLKKWKQSLEKLGVKFQLGQTVRKLSELSDFDYVVLALGGGSWLSAQQSGQHPWADLLKPFGVQVTPFTPANCGFDVAWKSEFLKEVGRAPLKNIILKTPRGEKKGEILITDYGVEGTPVYFVGQKGSATIDLFPDFSLKEIEAKLGRIQENLSPLRRIKKSLPITPAVEALLFHHGSFNRENSIHSIAFSSKIFRFNC
jgi:predicted flavoprotein YhiN